MFYICAVCMARLSPLVTLTPKQRNVLECIVSPIIDTTPLKDAILLLCGACSLLMQMMENFQNAALIGLEYLLKLHKLQLDRDICPTTGTKGNTTLEPDWIQNNAPNGAPIVLYTMKKKPEDFFVKHGNLDAQKCSTTEKKVYTTLEPDRISQNAVGQPAVEGSWDRSRRLELTEEVDLKSEPESEPEESEHARDSVSTHACDEEEPARLRQQSESKEAVTHASTSGGSGGCGEAEKGGLDANTALEERVSWVSWDVHTLTEAEAVAELAEARASAPFAAAPLRCEHCAVTFKNRFVMDQHAVLHNVNAGPYVCKICTQRSPSAVCLRKHVARHLTRYTCRSCRHSWPDLELVRRHRCTQGEHIVTSPVRRKRGKLQSTESADHGADCVMCQLTYKDWRQFADHYQSAHHDPARSDCHICHRPFQDARCLPSHVRKHFIMALNI